MKKPELKKLIKEVLKEQSPPSPPTTSNPSNILTPIKGPMGSFYDSGTSPWSGTEPIDSNPINTFPLEF